MPRSAVLEKLKCPMGIGLSGDGSDGIEPATSGVKGRRSNQLSYAPAGLGLAAVRSAFRPATGGRYREGREAARSTVQMA